MQLTFTALAEPRPGPKWQAMFERLWPQYQAWWMSEGETARPTYLAARRALHDHMPELLPVYEQLCELAGGGDRAARFLTLYEPPAYITGCSQAIWNGPDPLLVRNYDYHPQAFDGVLLRTRWLERDVIGMSDCAIGLLDGMNDSGLAVSLTFGGRRVRGHGFGVPIVLRYILETCETAAEAGRVLERVPVHMAYNVTVLDRHGKRVTAMLSPDRGPVLTNAAVATNHQDRVEWPEHARATATVERERYLLHRLTLHEEPVYEFIGAFLRPPIYSLAFQRGFGTLYTAAYWPAQGAMSLYWPGSAWRFSLGEVREGTQNVSYGEVPAKRAVGA